MTTQAPDALRLTPVSLDEAQQKAIEHAAMDAGAYSWRHCRLAMVAGDEIVGYPAFSRADLAELGRLYAAAPAEPAAGREESKTYYGKDCPVGMVQVEFVGCPPSERYSEYGWKPTKSAFIELYIDGQRYRIDAGDIGQNCFDGKPRRGVHINYPIGATLGDRSINALNLANPGAEPFWKPSETHPPAQASETGGERQTYKVTWVDDAKNPNDRRMYLDGQQWAKVYGWDKASLDARCAILEAALSAPQAAPGEGEQA